MDFDAYLARFGGERTGHPSLEALEKLIRAHVSSIPFENFDVIDRTPIVLDVSRIYAKIVANRRGGFCYELNSLFETLLRHLDYDVRLLSARVRNSTTKILGPVNDHVILSVALPRARSERYLVDVAFADAVAAPMPLVSGTERTHALWDVRLRETAGETAAHWRVETRASAGHEWIERYRFTLDVVDCLDRFADTLRYHQTDPRAPFMIARVCSLLRKDEGRVVFTDRGDDGPRLIVTEPNREIERRVTYLRSSDKIEQALLANFGIQVSL